MNKALLFGAAAFAFSAVTAGPAWADGAADLPPPPPSERYATPAPAVPAAPSSQFPAGCQAFPSQKGFLYCAYNGGLR